MIRDLVERSHPQTKGHSVTFLFLLLWTTFSSGVTCGIKDVGSGGGKALL